MSGWLWLRLGSILACLAVAAGAFGAHVLRDKLEARSLEVFHTAAQYQMYHALALVAVGVLMISVRPNGAMPSVAGWSFLIGILLFSGSLYALALTGYSKLGAITPLGGIAFLVGWIALAAVAGTSTRP